MEICKRKQICPTKRFIQKHPSKKTHEKVSNLPYKNEILTVYASSFGGMKMQIICNGCYSCCLVHCPELLKCNYWCSVQIYTEHDKNIYYISYSTQ